MDNAKQIPQAGLVGRGGAGAARPANPLTIATGRIDGHRDRIDDLRRTVRCRLDPVIGVGVKPPDDAPPAPVTATTSIPDVAALANSLDFIQDAVDHLAEELSRLDELTG